MLLRTLAFAAILLSPAAHAHSELPDDQKDATWKACVKYHTDHRTLLQGTGADAQVDSYSIERIICREPAQRAKTAEIASCLKRVKATGYDAGNYIEVCADNLGFGKDLDAYVGCYNAEKDSEAKADPSFSATYALNHCAIKEFRDNRAVVKQCLADGVSKYWNSSQERLRAFNRDKLMGVCADPAKRSSLPAVAACTHALSDSGRLDWKWDRGFDTEMQPESYIEKCSDESFRAGLDQAVACRRHVAEVETSEMKAQKLYDALMSGKGSMDTFNLTGQLFSQFRRCIDKPDFSKDNAPILECAIATVKARGDRPFVSTLPRGETNYYMVDLAEEGCSTESGRRLEAKTRDCMTAIGDKISQKDFELVAGENDRTNPKYSTYLFCKMTAAREESAGEIGRQPAGKCGPLKAPGTPDDIR